MADRQFYNPEVGLELKDDNTEFDVPAWREELKVLIEGTIKTRTSVHDNIHQDKAFTAYLNDGALDSGSAINVYLETSATSGECPHIIFDIHGSDSFDFEVLENPTVTSNTGSQTDVINKNRQGSNTSKVFDNSTLPVEGKVSSNVTVTADGTVLLEDFVALGHKIGGEVGFDREFILKPSTKYVFRMTSRGTNIRAHINLDWYEPI